MTIPVYQLGPDRKWDQTIVRDAVYGRLAAGGHETERHRSKDSVDEVWAPEPGVVVAPVGYADDDWPLDAIQHFIDPMDWCVVMAVSDETNHAEVLRDLKHPNMRLWLQTPRPQVDFRHDRYLPIGYSPHTVSTLDGLKRSDRPFPWVFQGQVNHEQRRRMVNRLRRRTDHGALHISQGFAQGIDPADFIRQMAASKIALCPAGPATPDSFRVAEAMEAGCLPVVPMDCPEGHVGYWEMVFGDGHPLIVCENWRANVDDIIDHHLTWWPRPATRVSAWWQQYKRNLQWRIHDDITELSGVQPDPGPTTVLIPTSPIKSHPDTAMIEQTVASVRFHFPEAEIIVMCDGVRSEQIDYTDRYEEYLNRLMWLCEHEWGNTVPLIFDEHVHQATMAKAALKLVRTPTILYVEHDCPLVTDWDFDWPGIIDLVSGGDINVMRFHFESFVLEEHKSLMLGAGPRTVHGVPLWRTLQWSQRPHLANTAYYRHLLERPYFDGKTMIEDAAISLTTTEPWGAHRVAIYHPEGIIKRSYTLDGRGDDMKWPDS